MVQRLCAKALLIPAASLIMRIGYGYWSADLLAGSAALAW